MLQATELTCIPLKSGQVVQPVIGQVLRLVFNSYYITALAQSSSLLWIEGRLQKWDILLFISALPCWKGAKRFCKPSKALYKPCWLPEHLQHSLPRGPTQTLTAHGSIAGILWDRKQRASFLPPYNHRHVLQCHDATNHLVIWSRCLLDISMHKESSAISLMTSRHVLKIYVSQKHIPATIASYRGQARYCTRWPDCWATGNKLFYWFYDLPLICGSTGQPV